VQKYKDKYPMPRDNFSPNIKRRLAERAGYLCSICNVITVGPSNESDTAINLTGVAAHITAASEGFKRFDNSLTPEERAHIDNGIWLCNTHADLIDGDEVTFTTPYLKIIKQNHEQKIKLKHSGINVEKGVITKIELSNFGLVTKPIILEFTDRNIIRGDNGTGKTLILELIASLNDKSNLDRWISNRRKKVNSFFDIYYFKNQPDKFSISIDSRNKVAYSFNDNPIPFLVPTMHILFLKQSFSHFLRDMPEEEKEKKSIIQLLSQYFNLTKDEFINVLGTIMRSKKYFCNDINFNTSKDDLKIKFYSTHNSPILSFGALSGGEKERVLLEITLKIANYFAKFNSTILLIENTAFNTIDFAGINHLFDIIKNEKPNFQFFFTTIEKDRYKTENFQVYELVETDRKEIEAKLLELKSH